LSAPDPELHVRGRIRPDDAAPLLAELECVLAVGGTSPVTCDVTELLEPDLVAMDTLARMLLATRRAGRTLALAGPPRELAELLVICGLWEVFPRADGSGFEALGKAEQREVGLGVEECIDPGDPSV
jgi:anti-anti-sigma regulatory factor